MCGVLLTAFSFILVLVTLPLSLCVSVKVVQEYERAVVFRLGRLRSGGAKGPGLFFIMPCIDSYKKVDLRTVSFDVPPQEVKKPLSLTLCLCNENWPLLSGIIPRLCDGERGRRRLLQGLQSDFSHEQH